MVTIRKPYDPEAHGARCSVCPLRAQGAVPIAPSWGRTAPVLPVALVAGSPGMMDVKKGEHLAAHADVKLSELLHTAFPRLVRGQLALVTSALLCRPEVPETKGRKRYDLKNWLAWFRRENALRRKYKQPEMENPFSCCAPRLEAEFAAVEAGATQAGPNVNAVIIPLDSFALAAVQGHPGKALSIMKYRGSVMPQEKL